MRTLIKAVMFLIIGCAVVAFTSVAAVIVVAALGGIFVGWLATLPIRYRYRIWSNERRTKVR